MKKQIIPSAEFWQQDGQYAPVPVKCDVNTQFSDIPLSQFSQIDSIDIGLALTGQGYGVCFIRSFRVKGHEAYPYIHVLSFGEKRVCQDFIATFRKDFQLQEAAGFLVDSTKELRQDYKGSVPASHTESYGCFYGRNRILSDFQDKALLHLRFPGYDEVRDKEIGSKR